MHALIEDLVLINGKYFSFCSEFAANQRGFSLNGEAGDVQVHRTVQVQAPQFRHAVLPNNDLRVVIPIPEVGEVHSFMPPL